MDWCDVCKYNPPDYSSHEPDKPCGDCWVYGEGNEPSKFVETENRQTTKKTHYDEVRAMSIEEIENWFWWMHKEMMRYTDSRVFLHEWLKQEAGDGE